MDSPQPSQPQSPVKKILVKRVKVLVKRPVAASPSAVPAPTAPAVKKILVKVPVKRPVAAAPAQTAAPPVKENVAPVSVGTKPSFIKEPPASAVSPQPSVSRPREEPVSENRGRPIVFELPDDILAAVEKYKKIPQKALALYIYARTYAEKVAREHGRKFPPMMIELPRDTVQMQEIIRDMDGNELFDAILDDFFELTPFIDGMERIVKTKKPLEQIIKSELNRLQDSDISTADQIILAYLNLLIDMVMIHEKMEMMNANREIEEDIKDIKSLEEEENDIKRKIILSMERRHFPVDVKKLVNNYFNLAKRDPDKAYETLITNPLFFSPILKERMPKKFFGLIKPSAKDAIAVNKQIASFFKGLKI